MEFACHLSYYGRDSGGCEFIFLLAYYIRTINGMSISANHHENIAVVGSVDKNRRRKIKTFFSKSQQIIFNSMELCKTHVLNLFGFEMYAFMETHFSSQEYG